MTPPPSLSPDQPQGVMLLMLWPDGKVLAEVSDFDTSGYGGFTKRQARVIRCKDRLWRVALDRLANPIVAKAAGSYHGPQIIDEMVRKHGFHIHEIAIGYDDVE